MYALRKLLDVPNCRLPAALPMALPARRAGHDLATCVSRRRPHTCDPAEMTRSADIGRSTKNGRHAPKRPYVCPRTKDSDNARDMNATPQLLEARKHSLGSARKSPNNGMRQTTTSYRVAMPAGGGGALSIAKHPTKSDPLDHGGRLHDSETQIGALEARRLLSARCVLTAHCPGLNRQAGAPMEAPVVARRVPKRNRSHPPICGCTSETKRGSEPCDKGSRRDFDNSHPPQPEATPRLATADAHNRHPHALHGFFRMRLTERMG